MRKWWRPRLRCRTAFRTSLPRWSRPSWCRRGVRAQRGVASFCMISWIRLRCGFPLTMTCNAMCLRGALARRLRARCALDLAQPLLRYRRFLPLAMLWASVFLTIRMVCRRLATGCFGVRCWRRLLRGAPDWEEGLRPARVLLRRLVVPLHLDVLGHRATASRMATLPPRRVTEPRLLQGRLSLRILRAGGW